jgi:hypothetical protein
MKFKIEVEIDSKVVTEAEKDEELNIIMFEDLFVEALTIFSEDLKPYVKKVACYRQIKGEWRFSCGEG